MKYLTGAIVAIVLAIGIFSIASAQQPRTDEVDIDLIGCTGGTVEWIDGTQVAEKVTVFNADTGLPLTSTVLLDIVGDQSGVVLTFNASPGTNVRAVLELDDASDYIDTAKIPACPTATPTATSTATPVPTSTPAATLTPIPTATQAPPQIIVQQVPVYVDRIVTQTITPPSTGDGGILIRE